MEGLHLVTAVTDRHRAEKVIRIFNENNVFTTDVVLGNGTASSEVLDYLYLTPVEKAIVFGIITDSGVSQLFKDFKNKMYIEVPGNGIVVSVPLNSVGGKRSFEYILDGQTLGSGDRKSSIFAESRSICAILAFPALAWVSKSLRCRAISWGSVFSFSGAGPSASIFFCTESRAAV